MKEEWRGNGSWEGGQMSVPWGGKVAADCGRREEGRKQDGWVRPVDGSSWRQGMKSGGSLALGSMEGLVWRTAPWMSHPLIVVF